MFIQQYKLTAVSLIRHISTVIFTITDPLGWNTQTGVLTPELTVIAFYTATVKTVYSNTYGTL